MLNNHSQHQSGGDSSTNIQGQHVVVYTGIDEKRAREIYQEMNLQLRKDYSQEALAIAKTRVKEFEDKLMQEMARVEGAMEAFADPGFQLLLVEAQKTAAATERPADHDLLAELLVHRFRKAENRNARAGISFAVEIVDKVSDEALLALTVMHAVNSFFPMTGDISQGLDILNELFGKIIYGKLPVGQEWLDHLDILNAVRLNPLGGLKKVTQYYPEMLPGFVDVGIAKDSDDHKKAVEILAENKLPAQILVDHALNGGFVRLGIYGRNQIRQLNLTHTDFLGQIVAQQPLSETQVAAMESIYAMYSQDAIAKQNNIMVFMQEWDKRPNLLQLKTWWDSLTILINITSVGKVLAHSNAQRCDKNLPPLDQGTGR